MEEILVNHVRLFSVLSARFYVFFLEKGLRVVTICKFIEKRGVQVIVSPVASTTFW